MRSQASNDLSNYLSNDLFSVTEKQSTVESVKHYVSALFEWFGEFWKASVGFLHPAGS